MIKTFRDGNTETVFNRGYVRKWAAIHRQAFRRLRMLDQAKSLADLAAVRGNNLHALRHERAGQHAIRVSEQWRICFVWRDGNAYNVEIVDYH